jgi:hypothetical protein
MMNGTISYLQAEELANLMFLRPPNERWIVNDEQIAGVTAGESIVPGGFGEPMSFPRSDFLITILHRLGYLRLSRVNLRDFHLRRTLAFHLGCAQLLRCP